MRLRAEHEVGWGETADYARVQIIADLIEEGGKDPYIREFAVKIVRSCPPKDYHCEVEKIFNWVKRNVRYVKDVYFADSYHTARRILSLKSADCDDFTILLGALLTSIGYPVLIRIVRAKGKKTFHHIYPLVGIPPDRPSWYPLDATFPHSYVGWEPVYVEKKDFKIIFE